MCAVVTGVQTCALPSLVEPQPGSVGEVVALAGVVGHRPGGVDEGALHERRTRPARLVGAGGGIDREQLVVAGDHRSEEHTSELQSLMRISYAVFCLKKNIDTS